MELIVTFIYMFGCLRSEVWVLKCWSAGVLKCWSAGVLECWSAGVLECWSARDDTKPQSI